MKLAVTVLSLILFACSVTTASPVNPSSTTSAESSTSTVISTATKSTEFEYRIISYQEATNLVDISQLSESDARLIEKYLQADRKYEETVKAYGLTESERLDQEKLIDQLLKEYSGLADKSWKTKNDPVCQKKKEDFRLKLREEREKLKMLEEKRQKLGNDFFDINFQSYFDRKKLAKRLFQNGPSTTSLYSYTKFLGSNLSFLENIYESLTLQLNQQSESKQASTSETQNQSQHHESPSPSSSETSAVQPTQPSSNTQATFFSTKKASKSSGSFRLRQAYSKFKNQLGSRRNRPKNDDSSD
ncbi:hypothetical protein BATDEDRAFT_28803 [Batrachochytrium dendrobatidis JAM81]|uniref:Uncharacterized protein n=1 Tax=Batrachochytrium dendrobatidis (strain JAM81 / FGSC 10211) TaxID=684364 RepID=F4PF69_BATDJ|nr:uncharacterized protein BATDEDRAFT_28803 [Batrachochytrium dendrobatidis JAM81]EGF76123.1 hypothetical protein BATDEDRAFT_28803 [Batrachochytrium dendrobatidis JAM81]|eukprot:XP_006683252.1 hypothetical protein BATDEDRAFT_28803 [Batrachochytrium dendrobatidis JAM81]